MLRARRIWREKDHGQLGRVSVRESQKVKQLWLRIDSSIVIRCKDNLYVQFAKEEGVPLLKDLVAFHLDKREVCRQEIGKIMVSIREV